MMRFTFLGTGNARGVPVYGCDCDICEAARQDDSLKRGPCSALIECGDERILLDAGLMNLAERFPPGSLSRILLTHYHTDHVQGLFHLRWGINTQIEVIGPADEEGCADLYKNPGILHFAEPARPYTTLHFGKLHITPLPMIHSKPTLGYCIECAGHSIAYLTDTVDLHDEVKDFLIATRPTLMVLDCAHGPQSQKPRNHNDLNLALQLHETIRPARTLLTHVGHHVDAWVQQHPQQLPPEVKLAYDGQCIELPITQ